MATQSSQILKDTVFAALDGTPRPASEIWHKIGLSAMTTIKRTLDILVQDRGIVREERPHRGGVVHLYRIVRQPGLPDE